MSSDFFDSLNLVIGATSGQNASSLIEKCTPKISHYQFYQLTLIPAVLITISFTLTRQRRNVLQNLWNGRPGLIFPMDTLTRSSRVSYGCSFGTTAFLVFKVIIENTYAINYTAANKALKSFVAIVSMFIYGLVFFPMFTSLAIGSVYGYAMGALYVWMLTAVEVYKLFECHTPNVEMRILLILRALPSVACLLYLSVSIPMRMVRAAVRGRCCYWQEETQENNTLKDIRHSYHGHHVIKLFRKPKAKRPPQGIKDCIVGVVTLVVHKVIYKRKRGFRYPARIISVLFVALLVVYMIAFELMALLPRTLDALMDRLLMSMDATIGLNPAPNEDPSLTESRNSLWIGWWMLNITKICILISTGLSTLFAVLNVLHMLTSYRTNVYAMYRGDHSHIPPASFSTNTNHCISSIQYAGFQVGYIIWSYIIHWCILTFLALILALVIYLITLDVDFWVYWLLEILWPIVLTVGIVIVVQFLMAKFVFLQECGKYLALNNRHVYFNFTYFMFFYNIFLGFASCVMRILKAMLLGLVFLGRLDNSTLSRRFEFFDPGFMAYVGYMHMEVAHTHPVLIVFSRLMLLGLTAKRQREGARGKDKAPDGADSPGHLPMETVTGNNRVGKHPKNGAAYDVTSATMADTTPTALSEAEERERRRRLGARFNWHLTYTLLHNPDVRVMRKGYINMLRRARLMGVHVPVSDRQADVNFEQLQERLAEARGKPKKKGGGKGDWEQDLKEVVTGAARNGHVKKGAGESSAGGLARQANDFSAEGPQSGYRPDRLEEVPAVRISPQGGHPGLDSARQGEGSRAGSAQNSGRYATNIHLRYH